MTTDTTDTDTAPESLRGVRVYPALALMERTVPPLRHGRQPLWRHPSVIAEQPLIPSWNWWAIRDFGPGTETIHLDTNAAYIGAIGQANIGHCQLTRTGGFPDYPHHRTLLPGYYRITVPYWAFSGTIVSPLGDNALLQTESHIWICAPTLALLLQLAEEGHIGAFEITDSYTAAVITNWRAWSQKLGAVRTQCLDQRDVSHPDTPVPDDCDCLPCRRYDAFKQGYSSALSMMLTGNRCQTQRPDWAHTVYATHAANQWRKAWRYSYTGAHIVTMGHVDEIQIVAEQLPEALARTNPPFRYDPTGRHIGAMKPKRTSTLHVGHPTGRTTTNLNLDDIV